MTLETQLGKIALVVGHRGEICETNTHTQCLPGSMVPRILSLMTLSDHQRLSVHAAGLVWPVSYDVRNNVLLSI